MKKVLNIVFTVIGAIIVFINSVYIVKSIMYPKEVPSFLGFKPYVVRDMCVKTNMNLADFVLSKKTENIKLCDVVVVKTEEKQATTYSVKEIDGDILKLENDTGEYVNLSKNSVEGKVVLKIRNLGEWIFTLRNPLVIFIIGFLIIILGIIIYKILKLL